MSYAPESEPVRTDHRSTHGATILVVEDDPRVVELLHIALGAHGFRVISALNGDDGWRMLQDEAPDLAIFDVRLPRRSGLELVESVRREPALAHLPVILVSALAETESRLAGLARGADDYLAKPFSPKELVARVRRMLIRAEDSKALVRRNLELSAEVERSRSDLKRLNHDLRREFWVKDGFLALSQELSDARRVEDAAAILLRSLSSHLGVGSGVVLVPAADAPGLLRVVETRGLSSDALRALTLADDGELARLVAGLARPVRRAELERFRELEVESRPLIAAGAALLVPLVTRGRLVGAVVLSEKLDGGTFDAAELELAEALAAAGATALDNASLHRHAEQTYLRALHALLPAIESLDPQTGGRARGMAEVAATLARELGLEAAAVDSVRVGALSRVLSVSPAEPVPSPSRGERGQRGGLNGSGALEGEILAVVEAYYAYLEGAGPGRPAADEVRQWFEHAPSGRGFDRQVTEALDDLLRRGDPGVGVAA